MRLQDPVVIVGHQRADTSLMGAGVHFITLLTYLLYQTHPDTQRSSGETLVGPLINDVLLLMLMHT